MQKTISQRTVRLAVQALKLMAKPLQIDANLFESHLCDTPHAEDAYKQRKRIYEAIAELERPVEREKTA